MWRKGLLLGFCCAVGFSWAINVSLKSHEPSWKRHVVERFASGAEKKIVFFAPTREGKTVPMQSIEFYPNGRIHLQIDLKGELQESQGGVLQTIPHGHGVKYGDDGTATHIFSYVNGKVEGMQYVLFPNGKIRSKAEYAAGLREGLAESFYEDGALQESATYARDLVEGPMVTYYPNGKIYAVVPFKGGQRTGLAKAYSESGALVSQENYSEGKLHSTDELHAIEKYDNEGHLLFVQDFKQGVACGLCMEYDPNGCLLHCVEFVDGKKQGREEFFSSQGKNLGGGLFAGGVPVGHHYRLYENGTLAFEGRFDEVGESKEPVRDFYENGKVKEAFSLTPRGLEGEYQAWSSEGLLLKKYRYKSGLFEGLQEEFYEDGSPKSAIEYASGKRHGSCKTWHMNGVPAIESHFAGDQIHGPDQAWYSNGQLARKENYVNGKLDGFAERYHESGALKEQIESKMGLLHGVYKLYTDSGQLAQESHFVDGKNDGPHKMWYPDGKRKLEMRYVKGQVDGALLEWAPCGSLIRSHYFIEGAPHGEQKEYYPGEGSRLKSIMLFDHSRPQGEHKQWHPNGRLAAMSTYDREGLLDGTKVRFDETGVILEEANYKGGKLDGRYTALDEQGRLTIRHYKEDLKHGRHEVRFPAKHSLMGAQPAFVSEYENDELHGVVKTFSETGSITAAVPHAEGMKHGAAEIFSKDGTKLAQVMYKNDKREGTSTEYYTKGHIRLESHFVSDKKEGEENQYHENGKLAAKRYYKEGLLDGVCSEWNPKGILVCEAHYKHGKREGAFKKFYDDGSLRVEQNFVNDQLDGLKKSYDKKGRMTKTVWVQGEKRD